MSDGDPYGWQIGTEPQPCVRHGIACAGKRGVDVNAANIGEIGKALSKRAANKRTSDVQPAIIAPASTKRLDCE